MNRPTNTNLKSDLNANASKMSISIGEFKKMCYGRGAASNKLTGLKKQRNRPREIPLQKGLLFYYFTVTLGRYAMRQRVLGAEEGTAAKITLTFSPV